MASVGTVGLVGSTPTLSTARQAVLHITHRTEGQSHTKYLQYVCNLSHDNRLIGERKVVRIACAAGISVEYAV